MAIDTWIDGAVDNIYAPYTWSNGTPQAGDSPVFGTGTAFLGSGDLSGTTLTLSGIDAATQPTLIAYGASSISVLVSQQEYPSPGPGRAAWGTVEVVGAPQVSMEVLGGKGSNEFGTVNIDGWSQMRGGFTETGDNASVVINGAATSTFANSASSVGFNDVAQIDAAVVGVGTFDVSSFGTLLLNADVSAGQTINDQGLVTIGDTRDFHGSIDWSPPPAGNNVISLAGLTADSSTYQNGVLSLFAGGNDVFDLHLQVTGGTVAAAQAAGGVQVYASATAAMAANAVVLAAHA
jgi:hypothetical protein